MHVGLVIYGDLDTPSGGFLYDRKLVDHLRDRGDAVEVISLPWERYGRRLGHNLSGEIRDRLDRPFDVLVQDELCHPSLFGLNRRLDADAPIVPIVHHLLASESRPAWQNRLYRWIERRYLRSADAAIYNSRPTRESVRSHADLPGVVAWPAGDRFDRLPAPRAIERRAGERPLRVVFVGSLVPRKGLDTLVRGLARLPTEEWRLAAIGSRRTDRAYVARVRRQVDALGVGDRTVLTGHLDEEALAARLADAHLLAVPSRHEGFGIVYLEGMGFGLPALATTAGGASDLVTHGEDGVLVPPDDPDAIARAVEPLLSDRERLREMSLAARRRYERHPTWSETMERVREFLAWIAEP